MKKKEKLPDKRKTPKNVELVSVLASYLDSELETGDSRNMTPLAKEIEVGFRRSNPHVDTVRNKLTEGFIFKDVLKNFKPTYENGKLVRIEKITNTDANAEVMIPMLAKINTDIGEIKKDLENLKTKK